MYMECSQLYRSWLQDNTVSEQNFLAYLKIHLFEYETPLILLQTKEMAGSSMVRNVPFKHYNCLVF